MVRIHIEIEGNNALEALADFRHLADALNPGHDADAPLTDAPSTAPDATGDKPGKSTRTRKSSKADKSTEPPAAPVMAQGAAVPTPATPAGAPAENTPAVAPESAAVPPAAPEVSTPTPAAPAPAPAAPAAPAPTPVITRDDLAVAGSGLIDKGRMADVMALLGKYGVQAITQLKNSDYPAFAADLRALGATI